MAKNTYFQGEPECDICGAPFFSGDEVILLNHVILVRAVVVIVAYVIRF